MINKLIEEMATNDIEKSQVISDYQNFTKFIHSFGINVRYLGFVYSQILKRSKEYPNILLFLERFIFIRTLKHIFRKAITQNLYNEQVAIAHLFNCIFAPFETDKFLELKEN